MDLFRAARHEASHGCDIAGAGRLTLRAIVDCLLFEGERISEVAKTLGDLKTDYEAFKAKMAARVDQLQAAVDAANANGAVVPPGVQSQIEALATEMESDTASAGEPAPLGEDNEPAGSGPSAGDAGLPEPVQTGDGSGV